LAIKNGREEEKMTRIWIIVVFLAVWSPCASKADQSNKIPKWPFFAFDNGVGRDKGWTPDQQATLLAELGYDGIGYTGLENLETRLTAMDAHGLKVFSIYEQFSLENPEPIPAERLVKFKQLKGTGAILWLTVNGYRSEVVAINWFRKVAGNAAQYGMKVAIYPHDDTYVDTGEHALKLAKIVDRPNFGMSINVCHELKAGKGGSLIPLIHAAGEKLLVVSVNGADDLTDPRNEKNWDRLIQPLGRGNFNLVPFFNSLRESGYEGPIGLQCFRIQGEIRDVLSESRATWSSLLSSLSNQPD
jgi:sugar phosphate isomerase/epimerase